MKPKKVMCPICGKEMIPEKWGLERQVYGEYIDGTKILGVTLNSVTYFCPCGNHMNYKGTESCWAECACKCKSCRNYDERQ